MVVRAYDSSYSGSRDGEDHQLKEKLVRLYLIQQTMHNGSHL
jgi:hypothetical protein